MAIKSLEKFNKESIKLLNQNRLLDALISSEILKGELSKIELDKQIINDDLKTFCKQFEIDDDDKKAIWMQNNCYSEGDLEYLALSKKLVKEYCKLNFSHRVDSHFLKRKKDLDVIIYSLIRVSNIFTAKEFYLRIYDEEADFSDLASQYSQGIEKKTRGLVGPITLGSTHPLLAKYLLDSKPGVVRPPIEVAGQYLVVRLESYEPAQLDDFMREKMGEEILNQFIASKTTEEKKNILIKHQLLPTEVIN